MVTRPRNREKDIKFPIFDNCSAREAINMTNETDDLELRKSVLDRAYKFCPKFVEKVIAGDCSKIS